MKILYFADIRLPLERANGIQTMETCHALAGRGHDVRLVVRPDTHTPSRDPFEYYGLQPTSRLVVERAPARGPQVARRVGYLAYAAARATGGGHSDVVMTRDLAVASLLLRLPARAPIVYESHGYAPEVSAALPELVSTARPPDRAKLARLARRESYVWQHADGYVAITRGLAESLTARFGPRARLAVVPDGTRITRQQPHPGTLAHLWHPGPWHPGTLHYRVCGPSLRLEGRRRAARGDRARARGARPHRWRPRAGT